jgi:hypothetical protein
MFYHSIVLLIFRPFIPIHLKMVDKSPQQISFSSAVEICTVLSYYKDSGYLKYPTVFLPHILLSAALVFIEKIGADDGSTLHDSENDQLVSSQLAFSLEQCILNLQQMSHTWDVSHQSLHVIWSRAAGLELPQRVKKVLYLDTAMSPCAMLDQEQKPTILSGLGISNFNLVDGEDPAYPPIQVAG